MRQKREAVPLKDLEPGAKGMVADLVFAEPQILRRLTTLGLIPGELVVVEQCRPDYLIRFGYTRLAINRRVAEGIKVYKMAGSPEKG
ncbi:MAG TPA: FeoA family protein [Bacillota bacterium]|nr:ferrous iron transport protein A [Bacillota bacterium]HOB87146.1 FeoA family protein [Bacillota bacterium]HPT33315.1 FeoA family protein [Bacillota bacterium]HPZ64011.1 FeoA family protein [Bacillota bacterium]HQD05531.1 FeoA family protein [Bacillota bacterium]